MKSNTYLQCKKCIMDSSDPDIFFNDLGVCNHCIEYEEAAAKTLKRGNAGERELSEIIEKIKLAGKGKKYDSILGISGGIDSAYLSLLVKDYGLRPLVVHFDNGWNSELAVNNVEKILKKLDFNLLTFVVNWEEFRDLQKAYFKASVVDIEVLTDHAISAVLYRYAAKYGVEYILSGTNIVTEQIIPSNWIADKGDSINIRNIHKRFGSGKLKNFPMLNPYVKEYYYKRFLKIKTVSILNYVEYNKSKAKQLLKENFGWVDYGDKHHESVFTRFYQGYILPKKFGIDKRKAHLSTLICSNQITKDEALKILESPPYKPELLKSDYEFVLKKLGMSHEQFEEYLSLPRVEHEFYGINKGNFLTRNLKFILNIFQWPVKKQQ